MTDQRSRSQSTAPERPDEARFADAQALPSALARRSRYLPTGAQVFFGALTLLLFGYTVMAFSLSWQTSAGQIGPGFFPRIIGVLGTVLALACLLRSIMRPASVNTSDTTATEQEGGTRYPFLIAVVAVALALFVTVFIPVGAPVTAIGFLLVMFFVLDRRRYARRAVLSLVFPVFLFFLFDWWLDAGLPEGITTFL